VWFKWIFFVGNKIGVTEVQQDANAVVVNRVSFGVEVLVSDSHSWMIHLATRGVELENGRRCTTNLAGARDQRSTSSTYIAEGGRARNGELLGHCVLLSAHLLLPLAR
jgi:predicted RNA-binding protein (virulence factor B family)